ncbi:SDR family NAD(P)-dependent oxidoreductase [Legionella micdadei]|uniref:NAD(P)-dependent dehydrogenase, short-chain alcohol dehydrogenase family n=1 Tax=Legionella micdadei TaxID=451 RepID=A0A098GGV1_LEGMI|nr:SDR family NAD(P)-dependent oxidoreductase [Legionella micdadei]ARG96885.1 sepiapterin reductase [Legionella micdadei]KTD26568.1 sepiapterin reductase [Legionella micdadei]NSL17841.1 SDR family NAD(P)-dependent oxidoreductase [Legionella micdadei]CEG61713.1 Short chain dehydrogenase/reductase family oxidoreductase [Legionella micdadei]SCY21291.1 NAD(P)-dependent dehydrogenase, short-chain alcohol dehydrogenase family [Legionella micdadei]
MFLITGGGSGIGRALAHALASRDKEVMIIGRREHALVETAAFSPLIRYICADVSTAEGRKEITSHVQKFSSLAGLIHNAGIIEPIVPLASIDEPSWQKIMATNLSAPLFLTQSLLDKLQEGRILHIGSGVAYFPVTGWSGYCVSKAGLSMLTRCWQLENPHLALASVMPGIIDTDMQGTIRHAEFMEAEKRNFFQTLKKENRLVSAETVALFLSWLLLDLDKTTYTSKEWDIYDKSHHQFWLAAPHQVPDWE